MNDCVLLNERADIDREVDDVGSLPNVDVSSAWSRHNSSRGCICDSRGSRGDGNNLSWSICNVNCDTSNIVDDSVLIDVGVDDHWKHDNLLSNHFDHSSTTSALTAISTIADTDIGFLV